MPLILIEYNFTRPLLYLHCYIGLLNGTFVHLPCTVLIVADSNVCLHEALRKRVPASL